MDSKYICSHLLQLAELLYGKKNDCYAIAKKNNTFIFGSKKMNIKNKVNIQIAIYLSIGKNYDNNKGLFSKGNKQT